MYTHFIFLPSSLSKNLKVHRLLQTMISGDGSKGRGQTEKGEVHVVIYVLIFWIAENFFGNQYIFLD